MWIVDSGGANLRSSDTPEAEGAYHGRTVDGGW